MADSKNKLDFNKLRTRKATTPKPAEPKKVYQEVVQVATPKKVVKKAPKKVGRKSWKESGVDYTRLAFDTPIDTKQKLKQLLVGKFFNKFISQDEMINAAIDDFIKKHSK